MTTAPIAVAFVRLLFVRLLLTASSGGRSLRIAFLTVGLIFLHSFGVFGLPARIRSRVRGRIQ